jgi:aminopeptidase N
MKWDEDKFGLEYDLDLFNIVAVSHFGGAMENKSLNIFSTGLIVATPESTTDAALESVCESQNTFLKSVCSDC